jgi:hypothetical protein
MNIAVTGNRYSNLNWPGVTWVEEMPLQCDFFIYCAPHVEMRFHPEQFVKFRETELMGVIQEAESLHSFLSAHPAPLGYPKFRDDFFVLKNGPHADEFMNLWKESAGGVGAVSDAVWRMGVKPAEYPPGILHLHCPEDSKPRIQWGLK